MKNGKNFYLMNVLILSMALLMSACSGNVSEGKDVKKTGEIVVGAVAPLTGYSIHSGLAQQQGIDLAIKEINASGGILGKTVRAVYRDDENDPSKSKTYVEELIDKENIQFLFGPINSTCAFSSAEYVNENKVIQLHTMASNLSLLDAEKYPYTFRIQYQNEQTARALVNIANRNFKKIALVSDNDSAGSDGMALLQEECSKVGITPVVMISHKTEESDMTTIAQKIKDSGAECVLSFQKGPDCARLVKTLTRIDYMDDMVLMGYNGMAIPNFAELAGEGAKNCYTIGNLWSIEEGKTELDPKRQEVYEKIIAEYGEYGQGKRETNPDWVAGTYDGMMLLKWAIETAGTDNPDEVKKVMETQISDYDAYYGDKYSFSSENHDGFDYNELSPLKIDDKINGDLRIRIDFNK